MTNQTSSEAICCPKFDPAPWDKKTHVWKEKPFITGSLPQIFHMPLPWVVGKVITGLWKQAKDSNATPDMKEFLMLAYDPSPWKSIFHLAVTKPVPGADNVTLSGTFISRTFDGPYAAVPKWIKEMDAYLVGQGKKALKYFFYYTTCPKCAKKYGHNYVVAFAQVGE